VLPAPAFGTWTTVKTRPAPVAPRKELKVTFKGVPLPTTPGDGSPTPYAGLLVVDSSCKSSPPLARLGYPVFRFGL
jgi:hypothetical protein